MYHLESDADDGKGCVHKGARGRRELSALSQFCCEPRTALKNIRFVLKKKKNKTL